MATYVTTVPQFIDGQRRDAGYEFESTGFRQGAIQRMLSQGFIDLASSLTIGAELRLSEDWIIPVNSTKIPFDVVVRDDGGMTTGAEIGELISPVSGWYCISTGWRSTAALATFLGVTIRVNGTSFGQTMVNADQAAQNITRVAYVEEGDILYITFYKAVATALTMQADSRSYLSATLIAQA